MERDSEEKNLSFFENGQKKSNYHLVFSRSLKKSKNEVLDSFLNCEDDADNKNEQKIVDKTKINGDKLYEDNVEYIINNYTPHTIERGLIESIKNKENVTKENLSLAEIINFKNKPDQIIDTDEFGFIEKKKDDEVKEEFKKSQLSNRELLTINARTEKWKYMINNLNEYKNKKKDKLKKRTRKGIPDSLRSYIWQVFGGIDKYIQKGLFEKLDKEILDPEIEITIIKDLDRTYPSCQMFRDKYGVGQRKLFKVLSNYSKYNKLIGYVQGMGYIAALFLIYMDEPSSFYLLHSLIKNYELESIFMPGLPGLKKKFYVLLNLEKKFIPKVYEVLKRDGIIPSLYASEWFICLFSKGLKPNALVRIFDTFLYEGFKVIYRFSLAFLKMKENELIKCKPGIIYTMNIINNLLYNVDVDNLFKIAFNFHLSRKHIEKYEREYEENKMNTKNEFIQQI